MYWLFQLSKFCLKNIKTAKLLGEGRLVIRIPTPPSPRVVRGDSVWIGDAGQGRKPPPFLQAHHQANRRVVAHPQLFYQSLVSLGEVTSLPYPFSFFLPWSWCSKNSRIRKVVELINKKLLNEIDVICLWCDLLKKKKKKKLFHLNFKIYVITINDKLFNIPILPAVYLRGALNLKRYGIEEKGDTLSVMCTTNGLS